MEKRKKKIECPDNKIINPKTNRCIKMNGTTAKKLIKNKEIEQQCPTNKILNPKTKRCIKKDGITAKSLIKKN